MPNQRLSTDRLQFDRSHSFRLPLLLFLLPFPAKKVAVRRGKKTGTFDRTPRALSDKPLLMECLVNCTSGPREICVTICPYDYDTFRLHYFGKALKYVEIHKYFLLFPLSLVETRAKN